MKALLQRVSSAKVTVNGEEISSIGRGIVALIGISKNDTEKDVDYVARKMLNLRLFEDADHKRWAKSVSDLKLEILCVSQFTLYHTSPFKGNKPDFRLAGKPEESRILYEKLLDKLKMDHNVSLIKDGVFGAQMLVDIANDGPVTVEIESPTSKPDDAQQD